MPARGWIVDGLGRARFVGVNRGKAAGQQRLEPRETIEVLPRRHVDPVATSHFVIAHNQVGGLLVPQTRVALEIVFGLRGLPRSEVVLQVRLRERDEQGGAMSPGVGQEVLDPGRLPTAFPFPLEPGDRPLEFRFVLGRLSTDSRLSRGRRLLVVLSRDSGKDPLLPRRNLRSVVAGFLLRGAA